MDHLSIATPTDSRLKIIAERLRRQLKTPFARNLGSLGGAQIAMRISRLLTTVILTRLLSPGDYGMAAIVLTVYELVALFTRNGISAKVVQASEDEVGAVAQTAYWMTWIVCGFLLVFQLLIAVPAAWLYHDMRLAMPIALMGLIYLATPLSNIQGAMMQREGRLGRIALAGGIQVTADNALTALFALLGMGMWAIILPKLLVAPIWLFMVRYGHAWRPDSRASNGFLAGWRDIARFSRHVIGVEILTTLQANIDNLLVGYFLGMEALGVYYFAFNAGLGITLGLVNAFGVAVYPHLCQVRGIPNLLAARFRATLKTLGMIVVPLVLLQVILAPVYVPLVFGQKWTSAIPVLMIICLSALPRPFASTCSQLLKAVGRPDIELRWQLVLTTALTAALLIGAQVSILAVAIAVLVVQAVTLTAFVLIAPRPFIAAKPADPLVAPEGLTFEIVRDDAGFQALRADWDALWSRASTPRISQSFAWCQAGWETTGKVRGRRLNIVVARSAGRAVLIWPLAVRTRLGRTIAVTLGSESTEYCPVLVEDGADAVTLIRAACAFIKRDNAIDVLTIPFVGQDAPMQVAIAAQFPGKSPVETLPSPLVSWKSGASWDQYWASRSKNLRSGTNRRRRRLEEQGTVTVEIVRDPETFARVLNWTLTHKIAWMKRSGLSNDFIERPEFKQFLLAAIAAPNPCGRLKAMTMRLDGRLIASKIGTVDGTRYEGFISVYDPDYATYSPGSLIFVDCLKWCRERGLTYDFRVGEESYKADWADDDCPVSTYEIANTAAGAFYLACTALKYDLRVAKDRLRMLIPPAWRQRAKKLVKVAPIVGRQSSAAPATIPQPA